MSECNQSVPKFSRARLVDITRLPPPPWPPGPNVTVVLTYARVHQRYIGEMDDRLEREAALGALSSLNEEILKLCEEGVEMLDAFQELDVISQGEKDDANENDDYGDALEKLKKRIDKDPNFIVVFCSHIKQVKELSDFATRLSSKLSYIINHNKVCIVLIGSTSVGLTVANQLRLVVSDLVARYSNYYM